MSGSGARNCGEAQPILALDARWLKTGIGRYTLFVLRALREQFAELQLLGITLPEHVQKVQPLCSRLAVTRTRIYTAREQWELPRLAKGASVFCAPHYNAPMLWEGRLLVTIHDLTHLLCPDPGTPWHKRHAAMLLIRGVARKANRIIVPSRYTKAMLMSHLDVPEDKVAVIPGCVTHPFRRMDKEESRRRVAHVHGIRGPYLLYVGNLAAHKNVPVLLKAFAGLRCTHVGDPTLVIASNDQRGMARLRHDIERLRLTERTVWLRGVDDDRLAELYAAATMTIMPSREEGFGLPVLESMACGTPVICARSASLPEVADYAALYFNPDSPAELSSAIIRLFHEADLYEHQIEAGLARVQDFSPTTISAMHVSLVRSLLECPEAT